MTIMPVGGVAVAVYCRGRVHLGGCWLGILGVRVVMGRHDEHGLRVGDRERLEMGQTGVDVRVMMKMMLVVGVMPERKSRRRLLEAMLRCFGERERERK